MSLAFYAWRPSTLLSPPLALRGACNSVAPLAWVLRFPVLAGRPTLLLLVVPLLAGHIRT